MDAESSITQKEQLEIDNYNKQIEKNKKVSKIVLIILLVLVMAIYFFGPVLFIISIFIFLIVYDIFEWIKVRYNKCIDSINFKHHLDILDVKNKDYKKAIISNNIVIIAFFINYVVIINAVIGIYDTFGFYTFIILPAFLAVIYYLISVLFNPYKPSLESNKHYLKSNDYSLEEGMFQVLYTRESVCMADDVYAGKYKIAFRDNATLEDLMYSLRKRGNGNDWPLANYGSSTFWIINSNIGKLGEVYINSFGKWCINYNYKKDSLVKDLGIESVNGERKK